MYNPAIGRWAEEGPISFRAGDANLYRYVGNHPTNATDPSGLDETPIGDPYGAKIDWGGPFTDDEKERVRIAFLIAAERVTKALRMVEDWDETTRLYRYIEVVGGRKTQAPSWTEINDNRDWFHNKLSRVYLKLMSGDTVIPVYNRPGETHPDRNPMYTSSINVLVTEFNFKINLRSHFWDLHDDWMAYWIDHEYARFFLQMDDDKTVLVTEGGTSFHSGAYGGSAVPPTSFLPPVKVKEVHVPGVQSWDKWIEWLNNRR